MCVLIFHIMVVDNRHCTTPAQLKLSNLIWNTSAMWYLQHGSSKGWEDSADANIRKCPSFTVGFCYQKNSVSAADPPKQDIGCPQRDFGIIFFTRSPPNWGHENVDCISLWESMPVLEDKVGECAAVAPFHRPTLHINSHMWLTVGEKDSVTNFKSWPGSCYMLKL